MFSAFKKLTRGSEPHRQNAPTRMSTSLQEKFSKGVQYNMKILIKGDRNVGKSCLLERIQGGSFIEEYTPTDEIQAAAINWTYKNTSHIVKVDVWEVVDKARTKRKPLFALKLDNADTGEKEENYAPALDATFVDVYKDASGVILMFDITKPWTFEYVVKELGGIPADIPLLLLGNHCDMQHHRQLHSHHIETVMQQARQTRSAVVRYAESSMRNGFGLRFLHKFLSVPFLRLQRTMLLQQLQVNQKDTIDVDAELNSFQNSEESNYAVFVERLASKRRAGSAEAPKAERSPSIVLGGGKPIVPPQVNPLSSMNLSTPVIVSTSQPEQPQNVSKQPSAAKQPSSDNSKTPSNSSGKSQGGGELDEFYAGALDSSFLDETTSPHLSTQPSYDSDSDNDSANPMVAFAQDDLDELDFKPDPNTPRPKSSPQDHPFGPKSKDQPRTEVFSPKSKDPARTEVFSMGDEVEEAELDQIMSGVSLKGRDEGGDGFEVWSTARRSPEGGEDPDTSTEPVVVKEEKKHKKKKSKEKDSEDDRSEKKHKHKKSKKERKQNSLLLTPDEETRIKQEYDSL